jgi:hypothetical protein
MQISKKNLLSLLKQNLNEMAMDFDTNDRPHMDVTNKLATGDTPMKKIPLPKTGNEPNKNFQELLASERYREVIANVRRYTNYRGPIQPVVSGFGPLTHMMMSAHNKIIQIENSHKQELERIAIQLVREEMGISEDEVDIDAKLTSTEQINIDDIPRERGQEQNPEEVNVDGDEEDGEEPQQAPQQNVNPQNQQMEQEIFVNLDKLNLERAKRRLLNSMIQGASQKGYYMYHYVSEELEELTGSEELLNLYGLMMSINDSNYWQFGDSTLSALSSMSAGKVNVVFPKQNNQEQPEMGDDEQGGDDEEQGDDEQGGELTKPKIIAQAINFPALVHEIIKGSMELLSGHGQGNIENPQHKATVQKAMELEDTLEKEVWDLRLGPAIWNRLRESFPEDVLMGNNKELQNYIFMNIFELPAKKFLVFMKEVISGSESGKRLMATMVTSIQEMLRREDYEESMSQFNDDLDDVTDETDEGDIGDFLNNLGISGIRSSDSEEDDDEYLD